MKKQAKTDSISTFLGSDADVEGSIKFQGTIRVDGKVSGKISSNGGTLIVGEKASILFKNNELRLIGDKKESIRFNLQLAYQQSYDNAIAHFIGALKSDAPFETDRLDNLETLRLVSDAYRLAGL